MDTCNLCTKEQMCKPCKIALVKALDTKISREHDTILERADLSLIQAAAMCSTSKITLVLGANRSGKSELGGMFTTARATGVIPNCVKDQFPMDKVKMGEYWISSLDFSGTRDITQPKVEKFLPKRYINTFNKLDHIYDLRCGSKLGFKSCESGRKKYQGTSRLGVWFDEEHPEDVYDEGYMRTIDCAGWLILTFTPVEGLTWAYAKMYLKAGKFIHTTNKHGIPEDVGIVHTPEQIALLKDRELVVRKNQEPDADDNIVVYQMSIYDNKFLPNEEIYNAEKKWAGDAANYNSRVLGRFTKLNGRNVFPADYLLSLQNQLINRPPLRVGEIQDGMFHPSLRGRWQIYKDVKPKGKGWYAIGADIAEGLDTGDYSFVQVIDMQTLEQVARWRGHISPENFVHVLYQLGKYYNDAYLAPERNFHGIGVVAKLRDLKYPRLYYDRDKAEQALTTSGSSSGRKKFGWDTNKKTKPIMIQELSSFIRDKHIILNDNITIDELITYVYNDDGSTAAMGGCFDDSVISLAIALQVATTRPIPVSNQGIVRYDEHNSITGY